MPYRLISLFALLAPAAAQSVLLELDCPGCADGSLMDAKGVGDVERDGFGDVAFIARAFTVQAAELRVASGQDGSVFFGRSFAGLTSNARLAGGDLDGDGFADVVVGLPLWVSAAGQGGACGCAVGSNGGRAVGSGG